MTWTLRNVESAFLTKRTANARTKQSLRFTGSPLGLGNLICNIGGLEEGLRRSQNHWAEKKGQEPRTT